MICGRKARPVAEQLRAPSDGAGGSRRPGRALKKMGEFGGEPDRNSGRAVPEGSGRDLRGWEVSEVGGDPCGRNRSPWQGGGPHGRDGSPGTEGFPWQGGSPRWMGAPQQGRVPRDGRGPQGHPRVAVHHPSRWGTAGSGFGHITGDRSPLAQGVYCLQGSGPTSRTLPNTLPQFPHPGVLLAHRVH